MREPICDFLQKYKQMGAVRAHMPGHKGACGMLSEYDITEVTGADSLFEAEGIIRESEKNASLLFGADTFYSTEGSSLSIRAMCYLVCQLAASRGERAKILAARNVHKVFVSAAALLDFDIEWIGSDNGSYLDCSVGADQVRERLASADLLPTALYITSPDYLGNTLNIREIADACHDFGVLLIVDNAHGAYLKFLHESLHPIDLGADMCCDSAHKTLPCLTGGAYLHIAKNAPSLLSERAKDAMASFASTSPSYLILASLDRLNGYLNSAFPSELKAFADMVSTLKERILSHGYTLIGDEPMKITVKAKEYGYSGYELQGLLEERNIITEFADPDYLVLMLSPMMSEGDLGIISDTLMSIEKRDRISVFPPSMHLPTRAISPRAAMLSNRELIDADVAIGRILAAVTVGCPPAVPIVISGEKIDTDAILMFKYYGIDKIWVIK